MPRIEMQKANKGHRYLRGSDHQCGAYVLGTMGITHTAQISTIINNLLQWWLSPPIVCTQALSKINNSSIQEDNAVQSINKKSLSWFKISWSCRLRSPRCDLHFVVVVALQPISSPWHFLSLYSSELLSLEYVNILCVLQMNERPPYIGILAPWI